MKVPLYRARLKGAGYVALILFLALPGSSLANSHAFLPISVEVHEGDFLSLPLRDLGSEDSLIARVMFTCSPGKPSILGKWALNQ